MARRTHLSLVVLLATLLPVAGCGATIEPAGTATTPTAATEAQTTLPPTLERTPQTLSVSVTGVTDHLGHELAGILYEGDELTDLDADALGGFSAVIDTDDFTTTETVRTPATDHTGRFPFVADTALTVEPGTYTLVIWVDHSLGGFKRWVPVNTDGRGLYGCHLAIDVGTEPNTTITVPANLQPDGWNVDCITGATTPNTDAAAAVAAPEWDDRPTAMDPITGLEAGQTLRVSVSGVSGRMGDEFAGVLYEGNDLVDLEREGLGGFWTVITSDDQSLTEVVRRPGWLGEGRFPYVSDEALKVEPGTYTLVLWVDETLSPVSRWVPINSYVPGDPLTEGQDLYACHLTFEVDDDPQTEVVVPANLHHNGWNVDCVSGATIPGTDAAAAVAPPELTQRDDRPTVMDPVTGLDAGRTVTVSVTGVTDHLGHELAGILYEGGELNDLDADALGGLWAVIDTDDFTTTETVRTPATDLTGRFPFVTDTALTVEPGTYTLVIWVDHSLGGVKRWVPINTDGRGLQGCHLTIDVGTEPNTTITVPANLQPDGWNVDCITGATTPNTDAAAAVSP